MPSLAAGRPCAPALIAAALAVCFAAPPALGAPLPPDEALARAAAADPRAPVGRAQRDAALADETIAGLPPEAALDVEVENAFGTGVYSGLLRADVTVALERTWERGGKREARVEHARALARLVSLRETVRRLDYLRDVGLAYTEALAAQADLVIAEAALVSAGQSQAQIERRVKSARDPLFAGARAEALTAQAEIARDQAHAAAAAAKRRLAGYWGGPGDFDLPVERFFEAPVTASRPAAGEAPDLVLLAAERDARIAAIAVARATSITDPAVRGGVRYLADESEAALVVGASFPLRGRVRANAGLDRALAERNAAEAELAAARIDHQREIARLVARMTASATESERIRAEVIPAALRTLDLVREGFARGGFAYDDVTGAERALFDARQRRIAVLRDYHLDRVAYERLTGRHFALASSEPEPRP